MQLFDQHVHGGGGYSFASDNVETILKAYGAQEEHGTGYLLATYVTLPYERLRRCLKALREAMKIEKGIIGAYLEGPFINPGKSGGMKTEYITGWNFVDFRRLLEEFADIIKLVVVAPERDADLTILKLVKSYGIKVSIGHTTASYEQTLNYIEQGADMVTHIFNAMAGFIIEVQVLQ